ncbi:MAG: hypothetical protein HKN00_11460 [Flavobacteriaceae bacterium]|nr:hypothetical protein [Bacteroidia bacterium]MBT8287023.1 hypothetical protein [Bacteroidia bacterium]NNF75796.1 hypothetical protein [Flavobacteriaceae bacterium]NNK88044.1 hypothetical protein [Flavobacteriaceae bacterium]
MKKIAIGILMVTLVWGCKQDTKTTEEPAEITEEVVTDSETNYPETLSKIFDAHGGLETWKKYKGMYFEIERSDYQEKYDVDLQNRTSRIQYKDHILGYDGNQVWVKNVIDEEFKGRPWFLYNLMYYFYAMPFIIGDEGINYAEAPNLKYGDIEYPGISITFDEGVGESSEDEYIIFYNPDTYQMEWLAYTVTFFTKSESKQYSLIKYHDWTEVNGLQMPSVVQWHIFDKGEVGDQINEMFYMNAKFSEENPDPKIFAVPEGADTPAKEEQTN